MDKEYMPQEFKRGDKVVYEGQLCEVTDAKLEWIYDIRAIEDGEVDLRSEFFSIPQEFIYPAVTKKRIIEVLRVLENNEEMLRATARHTSDGDKDAEDYHQERIDAIEAAIASVKKDNNLQ